MTVMEQNAQAIFRNYIFDQVPEVSDLTNKSLNEAGLEKALVPGLKRTHFDDLYDTLLYSKLIERALNLNPDVRTIIDLGAGSSIPTLLAIRNSGRGNVKTIAVDLDSDAHVIGSENARFLGLNDKFTFYRGDMEAALNELGDIGRDTLVVSNPPYIAAPDHLKDRFFMPINGGVNGDEYILKILRHSYLSGACIALLWGSLTSPKEIIPAMIENFETLHTEAHRIHFGNYTTAEPLRTHLYRLRDQGEVFFENSDGEGEVQYVFGSILKKK